MKGIILAAGRGSRLGDRTKECPKCLCRLGGRTLLDRALESLEKAGIQRPDIALVTGYCGEMLQGYGTTCFHNADWSESNMVWSLTMAREWLEREPCVVCYADIVFSSNAVQKLLACSAPMALTYYTKFWELWTMRMQDPLSDLETFRVSKEGRLLEIGNQPASREEVEGQYMGLLRFTPESWNWVSKTMEHPLPMVPKQLDMTTLLQAMVEAGYDIHTIPTDELWLECDTEQDFVCYEKKWGNRLGFEGFLTH